MWITKIVKSRFKKNSFAVFADGKLYATLPDEAIYKMGIKEGDELEKEEFDKLIKQHEPLLVMDSALRLLSVRARSAKELENRLKQKKFSQSSVKKIKDRLGELGYINDPKFAKDWASYRKSQKKGSELIKNELYQKGLKSDIVNEVIENLYSSKEEELEQIKNLADKKLKNMKEDDPKKLSDKLTGFLLRRGFPPGKVFEALRSLKKGLAAEDE